MRIDGKEIAANLLQELVLEVQTLKQHAVNPHLAIVLVGNDESSKAYVRQKELKAQKIGIQTTSLHLNSNISENELLQKIKELNDNPAIHGLIVQRPLPNHIDEKTIDEAVLPQKDIDSFHPNSPYQMPLAAAVIRILEEVYHVYSSSESRLNRDESRSLPENSSRLHSNNNFTSWLNTHDIVVIGKGKTGGGPTIDLLKQLGVQPIIVDSQTQNREEVLNKADIVISAVGKPNVIKGLELKQGVILIGVGIHRNADGKLQGDYNEEDIKDIASFYTPIPGGIGPVNVAMLLKNLIEATKKQNSS